MSDTLTLNQSCNERQQENQQQDAYTGEAEIGTIRRQIGGSSFLVLGQIPVAENACRQQDRNELYDFQYLHDCLPSTSMSALGFSWCPSISEIFPPNNEIGENSHLWMDTS